jgi:predicted metal-dependent enzyme (double-stranded beta helix superfamily)
MSSVAERRAKAVAEALSKVRAIEKAKGSTKEALEEMKPILMALAAQKDLFPESEFKVAPGKTGMIYCLSEDPDHRFALYASAGAPGKYQPPHNHTTWAVIAGVYGDEHNIFFERVDDGRTPGVGKIRKLHEITVRSGNGIGLLGDDIHCIRVINDKPSLHLHLYGLSLEHLPNRIYFENEEGGHYKVFPPSPITKVA